MSFDGLTMYKIHGVNVTCPERCKKHSTQHSIQNVSMPSMCCCYLPLMRQQLTSTS